MIIYKVTNQENDKVYIGMTTLTLDQRKAEHFKKFRAGDRKHALYSAFRKYGWENFTWEIIFCAFSKEDMKIAEQEIIKQYQSNKSGYNMTDGGDGVISGLMKKKYKIKTPVGDIIIVHGYKQFCRDNGLNEGSLHLTLHSSRKKYTRKDGTIVYYTKAPKLHHRGFTLLGTFNDHPEREYSQAAGNGEYPVIAAG